MLGNRYSVSDVLRAIEKADGMHGQYTCDKSQSGLPDRWIVQHLTEYHRCYVVDEVRQTCSCLAFEKNGVCKHQAFVHQNKEIAAAEEREEWGRHIMAAGKY